MAVGRPGGSPTPPSSPRNTPPGSPQPPRLGVSGVGTSDETPTAAPAPPVGAGAGAAISAIARAHGGLSRAELAQSGPFMHQLVKTNAKKRGAKQDMEQTRLLVLECSFKKSGAEEKLQRALSAPSPNYSRIQMLQTRVTELAARTEILKADYEEKDKIYLEAKAELNGLKDRVKRFHELNEENSRLNAQVDKIKLELASLQPTIEKAKQELSLYTAELERNKAELDKARNIIDKKLQRSKQPSQAELDKAARRQRKYERALAVYTPHHAALVCLEDEAEALSLAILTNSDVVAANIRTIRDLLLGVDQSEQAMEWPDDEWDDDWSDSGGEGESEGATGTAEGYGPDAPPFEDDVGAAESGEEVDADGYDSDMPPLEGEEEEEEGATGGSDSPQPGSSSTPPPPPPQHMKPRMMSSGSPTAGPSEAPPPPPPQHMKPRFALQPPQSRGVTGRPTPGQMRDLLGQRPTDDSSSSGSEED